VVSASSDEPNLVVVLFDGQRRPDVIGGAQRELPGVVLPAPSVNPHRCSSDRRRTPICTRAAARRPCLALLLYGNANAQGASRAPLSPRARAIAAAAHADVDWNDDDDDNDDDNNADGRDARRGGVQVSAAWRVRMALICARAQAAATAAKLCGSRRRTRCDAGTAVIGARAVLSRAWQLTMFTCAASCTRCAPRGQCSTKRDNPFCIHPHGCTRAYVRTTHDGTRSTDF